MVETLDGGRDWTMLAAAPVVAVTGVATAAEVPLAVGAFEPEIGGDGRGRVVLTINLR